MKALIVLATVLGFFLGLTGCKLDLRQMPGGGNKAPDTTEAPATE